MMFEDNNSEPSLIDRVEVNRRSVIAAIVLGLVVAFSLKVIMRAVPVVDVVVNDYFSQGVRSICENFELNYCEENKASEYSKFIQELNSTNNIKEAVALVRWRNGSEAEAVRYLMLIRAIQQENWNDKKINEPWAVARDALIPIWVLYPKLTTASQCYWCFNHDSNMYEWFNSSRLHDDYLKILIEYTPHLFGQFSHIVNDKEHIHETAARQSMLAIHGNRYGFLGKVLFENKDWDNLRVLVANTPSAAPIMNLDWQKIPRDIVELSWQQGVRAADDLPSFTEKMVRLGHRPALRWALWLTSTELPNRVGRMLSYRNAYKQLLERNTEFSLKDNQSLVSFYNQHWEEISFSTEQRKWVQNAK